MNSHFLVGGEGRLVFGDVVSGPMEKVMSEEVSHWEDSVLTMQWKTH